VIELKEFYMKNLLSNNQADIVWRKYEPIRSAEIKPMGCRFGREMVRRMEA
jgi:hypothetical protein